jgi:hypothetical protein
MPPATVRREFHESWNDEESQYKTSGSGHTNSQHGDTSDSKRQLDETMHGGEHRQYGAEVTRARL